ncbi:MAG: hypothetical protein ABIB72_02065 [Candidatus Falkowbacteria bacterium]
MKKIIPLLAVASALLMVNLVLAQDPNSERVSTLIDIRNDFILSEKGENQTGQSMKVLWQYKWIGGFLESDYKSKNHALTIKPSFLLKQGPWYFLGGASTNSQGSDFVQAGVWYLNSFGKFNIFLDLRNYWSVSDKENGYTDNLLRVMYPIGGKFSAGFDLYYDHWWNQPSHNWFLVGPRVKYQLTKKINIYLRVSHEWDVFNGKTGGTDRIITGIQIFF